MSNWKMKCTDPSNADSLYTKDKVYEVANGNFEDDAGMRIEGKNFNNFEEWQKFSKAKWDLLDDEAQSVECILQVDETILDAAISFADAIKQALAVVCEVFVESCDSYTESLEEEEVSVRQYLIEEAKDLICKNRASEYGDVKDNFGAIANMWNAYLSTDIISPHDVGVMMALLKIARVSTGKSNNDNYVDAIGYIALSGELNELKQEVQKDE